MHFCLHRCLVFMQLYCGSCFASLACRKQTDDSNRLCERASNLGTKNWYKNCKNWGYTDLFLEYLWIFEFVLCSKIIQKHKELFCFWLYPTFSIILSRSKWQRMTQMCWNKCKTRCFTMKLNKTRVGNKRQCKNK